MTITILPTPAGFTFERLSQPLLTPKRQPLVVPNQALAEALAADLAQAPKGKTSTFAAIAYTALDVMPNSQSVMVDAMLAYGETDLLLTRAEQGTDLLSLEQEAWDPVIAWATGRYDAAFIPAHGIIAVDQPSATVTILRRVLESFDNFTMAAFSVLVQAGSSLILALAVKEHHIDAEHAFNLSRIDEEFQNKRWGVDEEAEKRAEAVKQDMQAAEQILKLIQPNA